MRNSAAHVLVALFAIFAVADIVHDLLAYDPVHYFSEQPHELLVVAVIAIGGGLVALVFYRLSPHRQRSVKLFTLGSAAAFATVCGICFGCQFVRLGLFCGTTLALAFLCIGAVVGLLWFEFCQMFRGRVS